MAKPSLQPATAPANAPSCGHEYTQAGATAFAKAFPDLTLPVPSGHLRAQSRVLLRSGVREHVDAGYFLHGVAEAMEGRHG